MCWNMESTKYVVDNDSDWKKGYTVKYLWKDTGMLADKWCHSRTDCYHLQTILRSDEVMGKLQPLSLAPSHFSNFGFNIFTDKTSAICYQKPSSNRMGSEGVNVVVECWYRYVKRTCNTEHGPCVAAREMILNYVYPTELI
jgi:hypothetical protein